MEKAEEQTPTSDSSNTQITPSWAIKEDQRSRFENAADNARGYGYVWSLLIYIAAPALIALGGFLLRLAR